MGPELVGWGASAILLATLMRQVWTQAKEGSSTGVSTWLFVGQMTASVGFVVYSVLVDNLVFMITNSCILATAVVGQVVSLRQRKQAT